MHTGYSLRGTWLVEWMECDCDVNSQSFLDGEVPFPKEISKHSVIFLHWEGRNVLLLLTPHSGNFSGLWRNSCKACSSQPSCEMWERPGC